MLTVPCAPGRSHKQQLRELGQCKQRMEKDQTSSNFHLQEDDSWPRKMGTESFMAYKHRRAAGILAAGT